MINLYNGTGQYATAGPAQTVFNNWVLDTFGINTGDGLTGKHYSTFTQVNDPVTHVGKDDFYNNDYAALFRRQLEGEFQADAESWACATTSPRFRSRRSPTR